MIELEQLLSPDRILVNAAISSKKKALEHLSQLLASATPEVSENDIFNGLLGRERLGSTGLGHGVALPHGRMPSLQQPVGAFILLENGVDFDAPDQQPVDLLFSLLVPESCTEGHLQILAKLAELFSNDQFRQQLRESRDPEHLYSLITQTDASA